MCLFRRWGWGLSLLLLLLLALCRSTVLGVSISEDDLKEMCVLSEDVRVRSLNAYVEYVAHQAKQGVAPTQDQNDVIWAMSRSLVRISQIAGDSSATVEKLVAWASYLRSTLQSMKGSFPLVHQFIASHSGQAGSPTVGDSLGELLELLPSVDDIFPDDLPFEAEEALKKG